MNEFKHRMVSVINKNIDMGQAMNALGHISLALGATVGTEAIQLIDYQDADGNIYPTISRMPFIVLQANSNKIKELRQRAIDNHIQYITFTNAMTVGTWQEQIERSLQARADDLIFYAIVLLGDAAIITELTRKFSLWK
ncbi:MAG: DUF2000 domain-containing protein [Gammaproteobacteria bacterium]